MKSNIKKNLILPFLLLISLCALICGMFAIAVSTETVYASSRSNSAKCLTYGTTTTSSGSTSSGCPSNFKIYMNAPSVSGTSTIYQDRLLDWSSYNFSVETSSVSNHISFKLYRNGSLWLNKSLSGNSTMSLYSANLPDGEYELEYCCNYRPNIFVGYTTYTYRYRFEADKTDPSYSLTAGGYGISSGSYTNKQIVYTGIDPNFSYIYYKTPNDSSYYSYYATSYTVSATTANNGWWYFQGYDRTGSVSASVSVYLDTVKPTGRVVANGYTVSNGGYTNKPFYYTASDSGSGVSSVQYKYPGASGWYSYSSGSTLSGSYGWYTFRTIDRSGNISDEYKVYYDAGYPTGTLYGGTTSRSSGSYVNSSYVKYVASDSYSGIANCYVRMPGSSSYTSYASGTQLATEGTYYFYSVDRSGNASSTVSITLDKTKPNGTLYGGTTSRSSGSFVNSSYIKYTASDGISGVANCYVQKPGSSSYTSYTSGTQLTAEGTYYFYSTDRAGNVSATVSITLDKTLPVGTVYGGTTSKTSGSYVNASYIKYQSSDGISGISTSYVKMPGSSYYSAYTNGTQLATEGTYYFYSVDRAGNQSATVSITLDKTKPTGTIYGGTNVIQSGGATNASYIMFVPYDAIGVANVYVKKPGSNSYVSYTSGTQLTAEGTYYFYATDRANNASDTYSVTMDRVIPAAQLFVDDNPFGNNGYTNGGHIKFECSETCFVKKPGETSFSAYVSGTEYYKPGQYVFYGLDRAGNNTGNYTIVIDRTVKPLTVQNINEDGITDGDVIIDWTNGASDKFAPVKKVTINGKEYHKGDVVYTIDTGVYHVYSEDAAGNVWETEFASTKNNIVTKTFQKEFYEAHDADDNYFTFASYDSALAFAVAREKGYVRTGEWYNETWDTGLAMDAKDSVNAHNGVYFIYKKSGSEQEEIAYFTEERLNEVILEYAKVGIEDYFYWEKEFAPIADGENLYSYSDAKVILATGVEFGSNIGTLIDGEVFAEGVFTGEGFHVLTVLDEWNNSCEYQLSVVRNVPEIRYAINGGSGNSAAFDRVFRFKDEVRISISDLYDEFAMFNVFDEHEELMGNFNVDDEFTISESGTYTVVAVNHFGMTETFTLIISRDAPKVNITENTEDKKLEISITDSIDDESQIATLEIYKSTDNGETWLLLDKDDYGKEISVDTFAYAFRTSGIFKVVVSDAFRTGIDAVTQTFEYEQKAPVGILTGVENGGYTNGSVKFEWTDEAKARVEKDGEVIEYKSGTLLEDDGVYTITFENFDTFKAEYSFTIDTVAPVVEVHGAVNTARGNRDVTVTWVESNLLGQLYKDGKHVGVYDNGAVLKDDATYRITVTDLASNMTEVEFTIDKVADFSINVNDKGLANSVTVTPNETLNVVLTKGDETVEYELGEAITEPGHYTLQITDGVGNRKEMTFTVVEPLVQKFEYNFDDMPGFEKVTVNGEDTRLNYGTLELTEDGVYDVGVVVNGTSYNFTVTVDATAPVITLNGAQDGKTTNSDVKVSWTDTEAKVVCKLNGKEIAIENGAVFTEEGTYEIFAEDLCLNKLKVSFSIDKTLEYSVTIDGEDADAVNERLNKDVTFNAYEKLNVSVSLDGEKIYFEFGQLLTDEGKYEVRIFDEHGNSETIVFTIDKTAPTLVLNGVENEGQTKNAVTLTEPSEECEIKVFFNDEEIEYNLGDELTEAGEYRVELTDTVGNANAYMFTIQKTLSGGFIALFVILGIALVGGGVFAFLFIRKRKNSK